MNWIHINLLFLGCCGQFLENWRGSGDGLVFKPDDGEGWEGEVKRVWQSLPRLGETILTTKVADV